MTFKDFERCFIRAIAYSYSRKKIFFTIPFLFLCGVIIVLFRGIAYGANNWMAFGLIFLSIFFSFVILYILGVFLIKIYYYEVKNQTKPYTEVIKKSFRMALETLVISISVVSGFVVLWFVFGLFSIFKEIPHVGRFIGILISIIPFLIILITILFFVFHLLTLFFAVPAMTLKGYKKMKLLKEILKNLKTKLFTNLAFFIACKIVVFAVALVLIITAVLTKMCFSIPLDSLYVGLQWFFLMIPLIVFLSPLVIFFFNFSCETYNLLQKKD